MNAHAIVDSLLEDDFSPEEVEATAASFAPRMRWWIVPALFVVQAPTAEAADELASEMQGPANQVGQSYGPGQTGILFQDEGIPTTEIKEQPGEDFAEERPHSIVGYVPGVRPMR